MKRLISTSLFIGLALTLMNANIAQAQMNVYKLHSLFVYNFVKNINWNNVGDKFVIGVYAKPDAVNEFKKNFSTKNYSGKEFEIVSIRDVSDAGNCQIVYLPKSNKAKALLSGLRDKHVLVVTEDNLIDQGASISFKQVGAKLNFIISKSHTEAKGLKVSGSLMALATVVG